MTQYINKSALVAEIERLNQKAIELYGYSQFNTAYNNVLKSISTLEVKEVDLNEEIDSYFKGFGKFASVGIDDCIDIAKHFYELGLKAQKGE